MRTDKLKKYLLPNLPYLFIGWACLKVGTAYRLAAGADLAHKLVGMVAALGPAFADFAPGLVFVRTVIADVDFRCVKKCVAMFYCRLDDPGHFLLVRRRAEGVGHAHAAQAHRRYLQAVS